MTLPGSMVRRLSNLIMGTECHIREEKVVTFNFMPIAFIVHFVFNMQNNISV